VFIKIYILTGILIDILTGGPVVALFCYFSIPKPTTSILDMFRKLNWIGFWEVQKNLAVIQVCLKSKKKYADTQWSRTSKNDRLMSWTSGSEEYTLFSV